MEHLPLWLQFVVAGFLGALCRELVLNRRSLVLPRVIRKRAGVEVRLGFLGGLIVGVATAVVVDHTPAVAFWSAVAATHLIEEVSAGASKRLPFLNHARGGGEE